MAALAAYVLIAAAFRRLCVETYDFIKPYVERDQPPLGGCVLKLKCCNWAQRRARQPPLGGCVLKQNHADRGKDTQPAAAFRRLCVETGLI